MQFTFLVLTSSILVIVLPLPSHSSRTILYFVFKKQGSLYSAILPTLAYNFYWLFCSTWHFGVVASFKLHCLIIPISFNISFTDLTNKSKLYDLMWYPQKVTSFDVTPSFLLFSMFLNFVQKNFQRFISFNLRHTGKL